jgi:N-carbamoylputrescine amidase
VGWIIDPYGTILARTSPASPFATIDIDLTSSATAQNSYPCYALREKRQHAAGVGVW